METNGAGGHCFWLEKTARSKFCKILVRVPGVSVVRKLGVLAALVCVLLSSFQNQARGQSAGPARIFVLTSTYGVMAGSLTGLASLAFYESPSDNLRNVAMGASIGLYVGLLLGTYIMFFGPSSPRSAAVDFNMSSSYLAGFYPIVDPSKNWGLGWSRQF